MTEMKRTGLAAALILTAVLTGAADCSKQAPGKGDPNPRPPYNSAPAQVKPENVDKLCRFFVARSHETLLKPDAEGNVNVMTEYSGIPSELKAAARAYYQGESLGTPIDTLRRATLDAKYKTVMDRCASAGWRE